jgi:PAS domain S-box-containing protein
LLDAFPGFIAALDGELRYQFVNDSLTKLLRRCRDDLIGRSIADVLDPARLQEVVADIAAAREGSRPSHERHYPPVSGRAALDVEVTHVAGSRRPDGTQVVYAFGIDITARKQAEEALIAARDEAERANLAKSQFLSQMSHELRTPMNAILGLGQLLVSDPLRPLVPTQRAYVDEMLRGARHLLDLINEVLDLGRVEAGQLAVEPATVRLAEVVEECASLVRPLAAEHQVTIALTPPCNFHVHVDRTRLKQVLLNLLGNAVKYNRRPGSVLVACGPDGDGVRLLVRDTGRGLTTEEQQRLFRPFERLGAARSGIEGTGIGLALSRRLVEAMGGSIGVESEPGVGSTFWLRLPRAEAPESLRASAPVTSAAGGTAAAGAAAPAAGHRRPTVLYIEDNPVNVFVMEALFERLPELELVCAPTPAEGLQTARTVPPALVLLDVQLPDMDGAEVLARLKAHERTRDIPVVAVSANAMSTDIETMMNAGAADYLTKPVDLERLLTVVKQWVPA